MRAVAQDIGAGDVWVEKVEIRTQAPAAADWLAFADGPLGELLQSIAELRAGPEKLAALGGELADLLEKLPELKEGAGSMDLARPERLRGILDEVEQLLVHQLLAGERPA